MIRWKEGEVSPKDIYYGARVVGARSGVSEREV